MITTLEDSTIRSLFHSHNGFIETSQLRRYGVNRFQLQNLLEAGLVERIRRGLYQWVGDGLQEGESLVAVSRSIPRGVFCLTSALDVHDVGTHIPAQVQVAIRFDDHATPPDYPPTQVFYWSKIRYDTGIERVLVGGEWINVYNLEKTICDLARYRKKLGKGILIEAIREYFARSRTNVPLLSHYAKELHVSHIINPYVEVLLG